MSFKMLIGYARVSTLDQNLDLQINALKAAGCENIFTEKASGAQRERPELKAALSYMRNGDTLIVWKLDRLARSIKQLMETIEDLEQRSIGFKSLTECMDTTTSGGKLIFHIFASLAEFERSLIKERTRAGLASAKLLGKVGGRPKSLNAHDLKIAKTLLTDPSITFSEVAERIKVNVSTLYRYFPGGREQLVS